MNTELILKIDNNLPKDTRKILLGFQVDDIPIGDLITIEDFLLLANDMTINSFPMQHEYYQYIKLKRSLFTIYYSYDINGLKPMENFSPRYGENFSRRCDFLLFRSNYINNTFTTSR